MLVLQHPTIPEFDQQLKGTLQTDKIIPSILDNFKQSSEVKQTLHKGLENLYQEPHLASGMFQKHPELKVKKKKI